MFACPGLIFYTVCSVPWLNGNLALAEKCSGPLRFRLRQVLLYLDKLQTCDPPSLLFHGYRNSIPGVKRPGRNSGHSPPSSAEVKNEWSYTSTLPVCPHVVGRDIFLPDVTFTSPSMASRLVEELTVETRIMRNELVLTYQTIRCHILKYRQSEIKKPHLFSSRVRQNIGINFNSSTLILSIYVFGCL